MYIYFSSYRPQRSCGQGNIFTPVCHSVPRGGGVCLTACWDATPRPPGADTLPEQTPPRTRPPQSRPPGSRQPPQTRCPPEQTPPQGSRLQHTVYERLVRILLECILVYHCSWKRLLWIYWLLTCLHTWWILVPNRNMYKSILSEYQASLACVASKCTLSQ